MRWTTLIIALFFGVGCSSDDNNTNNEGADASQTDASQTSDAGPESDVPTQRDVAIDADADVEAQFCASADCTDEKPICSELVQRCVECTSDGDCTTAPRLTCETTGTTTADPLYECVECVDDSVCGGGTCDLESHTCVL